MNDVDERAARPSIAAIVGASLVVLLLTALGIYLWAHQQAERPPVDVGSGSTARNRFLVDRPEGRLVATWLRDAGFKVSGDTGSALIARGNGTTNLQVWASSIANLKADPQVQPFEYPMSGYDRIGDVDGVDVSSDGVRISWDTPTHRLWVSLALDGPLPTTDQLAPLVRTTLRDR